MKLGEILIGIKAISFLDLTLVLYQQFSDVLFEDVLIKRGLATPVEIQQALAVQAAQEERLPLGEILLQQGVVTPEQVAEALEEHQRFNAYKLKLLLSRHFDDDRPVFRSPLRQSEFSGLDL